MIMIAYQFWWDNNEEIAERRIYGED